MRLQDELKYLKSFVKLSEKEAFKRDELEAFLETKDKVVLLDADSLLFNVAYVNFETEHEDDLEKQYEDYHQQVQTILNRIEEDGFNVASVQHCFTTAKKNFRKELYSEYKANRKPSKLISLVSLLKYYTIQMLESEGVDVKYSKTLEADDIIAEGVELFGFESIVVSIDKDLRQLNTAHFDYYRVKTGEIDEEGNDIKEFRGWSFTSEQEGYELLLKQLLVGDTVDNIKGVHGIGEKKADKLLEGTNNFGKLRRVVEAYNDTKRLKLNIKLMKL